MCITHTYIIYIIILNIANVQIKYTRHKTYDIHAYIHTKVSFVGESQATDIIMDAINQHGNTYKHTT